MEFGADHAAFTNEKATEALTRLARYDDTVSVDAVVEALEDGSAFLLPHRSGFSVLTLKGDALHVWISCVYVGHMANLAQCAAEVTEVARALGLGRVTFKTTRKGWQRVAPQMGFNQVSDNSYERVL